MMILKSVRISRAESRSLTCAFCAQFYQDEDIPWWVYMESEIAGVAVCDKCIRRLQSRIPKLKKYPIVVKKTGPARNSE